MFCYLFLILKYTINKIKIKRGPAQYDNAEHTTFTNTYKPLSNKGYIVGARTGQREYYQINVRKQVLYCPKIKVYLLFLIAWTLIEP